MSRIGQRAGILRSLPAGLIVGALAILVAATTIMARGLYYQDRIGRELSRNLGFTHGSPYVRCGDRDREVFAIESVEPGGAFDRAGFRDGDIVVGTDITGLYRELHRNRGREVTVSVVEGGDGPPLAERPVRKLCLAVPEGK